MLELTVVMSVYNGGPYVRPAIESILTQSIRDFEFLIVDDGSTDGSTRILEEYARRDSRIRLIRQANAGTIASLIKACGLVATPYIARMDADDISAPRLGCRDIDQFEFRERLQVYPRAVYENRIPSNIRAAAFQMQAAFEINSLYLEAEDREGGAQLRDAVGVCATRCADK